MSIKIKRIKSDSIGTIGELSFNGEKICFTLELPWLNNQKFSSCIPDGKYQAHRFISPKFGEVFKLENVRDRQDILIHKGNYLRDTSGCVLVGLTYSEENSQYVVYKSKDAFNKLMETLKDLNEVEVEIL